MDHFRAFGTSNALHPTQFSVEVVGSGGEALSEHTEGFDPLRAHPFEAFGMEPAVVSHRELGRCGYPQLLGVHAPACLCTRLSTSSRLPVLLRA